VLQVPPSSIAASSISEGSCLKKMVIIHTAYGKLKAIYGKIIPGLVSNNPNFLIMRKIGMSAAIGGIMRVLRIQNSRCRLPRIFIFANPNAAGVANSITIIVVMDEMISELKRNGTLDSVPVNRAL
jgi:hypothetical protein